MSRRQNQDDQFLVNLLNKLLNILKHINGMLQPSFTAVGRPKSTRLNLFILQLLTPKELMPTTTSVFTEANIHQ